MVEVRGERVEGRGKSRAEQVQELGRMVFTFKVIGEEMALELMNLMSLQQAARWPDFRQFDAAISELTRTAESIKMSMQEWQCVLAMARAGGAK